MEDDIEYENEFYEYFGERLPNNLASNEDADMNSVYIESLADLSNKNERLQNEVSRLENLVTEKESEVERLTLVVRRYRRTISALNSHMGRILDVAQRSSFTATLALQSDDHEVPILSTGAIKKSNVSI